MRSLEAHLTHAFARWVDQDVKTGLLMPEESRYLQRLQAEGHGIEYVCAVHAEIIKSRLRRKGMRWLIATLLLILLAVALNAYAQIPFLGVRPGQPVYDAANHLQNTISAVEAVLQTAHWVTEQLALEGFVVDGGALGADLGILAALVTEAQGLGFDVGALESTILTLFTLETAPQTSFEYRQRQLEIKRSIFEGYSFAMRTQTPIQTALRTVTHITGILEQVSGALGNLSISQTFGQSQAKLQQLLTEAQVSRAAFERAKSLEGAEAGVLLQGMHNLMNNWLADHP
jgi:hypothetical protein